jgi:CheY-like chemotaxis protein
MLQSQTKKWILGEIKIVHYKKDNKMIKVLIVEDHLATGENIGFTCEEFGCDVYWATTLLQASCIIIQHKFQLIIWDFNLPDGISIDLIKLAREKFPEAIMVASSSNPNIRALQQAAGCNLSADPSSISDFLRKEIPRLICSLKAE